MATRLDVLRDEVKGAPEKLTRFAKVDLPKAARGSIFVGAGDSYATALVGFYASRGRCLALDPYVLASSPEFADGSDVYFVSVSGRTTSNALAASRVEHHAKRTVAMTAVMESPLARIADEVIRLPIVYKPRMPGMLSFSLTLLAVLKLLGLTGPCDFGRALAQAKRDKLSFSRGGTTYLLGNSLAYPLGLYGAAKAYEVLGARAHAELLEEFSHLELFSLRKSDVVDVFASFDPESLSSRLTSALKRGGHDPCTVRDWGSSTVEQLFHAVFVVQLSVLRAARERGISEPRFLTTGGALTASDEMIY